MLMESNADLIVLNPLLHYKKPEIRNNSNGNTKTVTPLQIAFPTGGSGIGVPAFVARPQEEIQRDRDGAVIISANTHDEYEQLDLRYIKFAFILFAIFNFIVTALMYFGATHADPSSVSPFKGGSPSVFEKPSPDRPSIQQINFGFFLGLLAMGCLSAIGESALGLSMYALAITLNFLLGTSALPYYLFSMRYLVDIVMLYLALVIRSRVMYLYLPTKIFDIRNRFRLP